MEMYNNRLREVDGEETREEQAASFYALFKNKNMIVEGNHETKLIVVVHHLEGVDDIATYPTVVKRLYSVEFWMRPDKHYRTRKVYGEPDPVWNRQYSLPLDTMQDCRYLYVEVHRWGFPSESETGTSDGVRLVGRARIPLPKPLTKKTCRFGLVRFGGDGAAKRGPEGHIVLSMSLIHDQVVSDW